MLYTPTFLLHGIIFDVIGDSFSYTSLYLLFIKKKLVEPNRRILGHLLFKFYLLSDLKTKIFKLKYYINLYMLIVHNNIFDN